MDDSKNTKKPDMVNKSILNFIPTKNLSDTPISTKNLPKQKPTISFDDIASSSYAGLENTMHVDRMNRFNSSRGAGFAAEQANHLGDKALGRDAKILGDNNAKNGADRIVDGQLIQTKYCKTAAQSVDAGFSKGNGQYKYLDAKGNPMQLEVPSDQYEKAVERMAQKIKDGKVPNTTDPNDAKKLIRKGHVTYKQAQNIAKAGNIDSLMFDAAHGVVVGISAAGISSIITFAQVMWRGDPREKAIDMAMYNGIQAGGVAFASSVLTAQLTRTSLNKALIKPMNHFVKLIPKKLRHIMVNAMRKNARIYGSAASKNLAKLLRGNVIATVSTTLVLSSTDIYLFVNSRISGKQLFKNMTVIASGTSIGAVASAVTANPVLAIIVSGAAGVVATKGTKALLDQFVEDDAVKMVSIINECFVPLVEEYLLSEEELMIVADSLNMVLGKNVLLAMYASSDRYQYAHELLIKIIEDTVQWRNYITMPDEIELTGGIVRIMEATLNGEDVLQRLMSENDVTDMVKDLGNEIPQGIAAKAGYVTKQRNISLLQGDAKFARMAENERHAVIECEKLSEQIKESEQEFYQLIEEQNHE